MVRGLLHIKNHGQASSSNLLLWRWVASPTFLSDEPSLPATFGNDFRCDLTLSPTNSSSSSPTPIPLLASGALLQCSSLCVVLAPTLDDKFLARSLSLSPRNSRSPAICNFITSRKLKSNWPLTSRPATTLLHAGDLGLLSTTFGEVLPLISNNTKVLLPNHRHLDSSRASALLSCFQWDGAEKKSY